MTLYRLVPPDGWEPHNEHHAAEHARLMAGPLREVPGLPTPGYVDVVTADGEAALVAVSWLVPWDDAAAAGGSGLGGQ